MAHPTVTVWDIGDEVTLQAELAVLGVPTDPTTLTWRVEDPDGVVTVYEHGTDEESQQVTTGVYTLEFIVETSGVWHYRVEGTGAVQAAEERDFYVRPSDVV